MYKFLVRHQAERENVYIPIDTVLALNLLQIWRQNSINGNINVFALSLMAHQKFIHRETNYCCHQEFTI